MTSKVYVVVEYGEGYGDRWEHIIGVCSSSELADELKSKAEEKYNPSNLVISEEDWNNIVEKLWEVDGSLIDMDSILKIKELFPQYSEEDIRKAIDFWENYGDLEWHEVSVKEIDFYTNLSDIPNGN